MTKQYKFTAYAWDKYEIDSCVINASNYKEALGHARFYIRYSIVKFYSLKLIRK
jgi:hypothetical protein